MNVYVIVDVMTYAFYMADIIVSFNTNVLTQNGELDNNRKSIAKNYMKTRFFVDII